jgi:hypothetical protein
MLEEATELLYRHPEDCRAAGALLYTCAAFALIAGTYVKVATSAMSIATSMAGRPAGSSAAEVLPGLWTWWIPESVPGFVVYAAVAAAGALLAVTAKKVQRRLGRFR